MQDVIEINDKEQKMEMRINFVAIWKDSRIFSLENNRTHENINLNRDRNKIFLPDFYVQNFVEQKTIDIFSNRAESLQLYYDKHLQ
jgi:hypothetical protein